MREQGSKMRVVAFVPAKGESNRIRNKNTVVLDGEYLFKRKLRQLLACPDIDGALVGGAALDADGFGKIAKAALAKN